MKLLAFILAAPLIVSNSTEKGFNFVVRELKPAKRVVKVRLYNGDEYDTKLVSTAKTKHRVEARGDDGKRVACAEVTNASQVDLVVTPDRRYHFVCTGGEKSKETVTCRIRTCP